MSDDGPKAKAPRVETKVPTSRRYALLVPQGLEAPAQQLLLDHGLPLSATVELMPRGTPPKGRHLARPGEISTLVVTSREALPASVLACPALFAALAVVYAGAVPQEILDAGAEDGGAAVAALAVGSSGEGAPHAGQQWRGEARCRLQPAAH